MNKGITEIMNVVSSVRADLGVPAELNSGTARVLRKDQKTGVLGANAYNLFSRVLAGRLGFGRATVRPSFEQEREANETPMDVKEESIDAREVDFNDLDLSDLKDEKWSMKDEEIKSENNDAESIKSEAEGKVQ